MISTIFRIIFQKIWHNSWRHHPYSCNFEKNCPPFFCNITNSTKYDFAKFHVKTFSYHDLRRGRGIIRQKYPGADKVKTLHQKWSFPLRISSVNVTKSAVVRCKSYCLHDRNRIRARYYRRWTPKVILNAPFSSVPNGHVSSDY